MGTWSRWQHRRKPWQQGNWLAVDIETNGLDTKNDAMLTLAWVPIRPPVIAVDRHGYKVVQRTEGLSQAAVVHQLSSADLAAGEPLEGVMRAFMEAAQNSLLVAHNVRFDYEVLQVALAKLGQERWRPDGLYCTLQAERRRLLGSQQELQQGELTLAACRARYGLPEFNGHHALNDAIACAELFLAQSYRFASGHQSSVAALLKQGR
ncbi:MAG: 3'-5' exonuclease [Aliidiomarina sp.]|uniref:3'-5' exonuclease n=1 Tax=Aliidiomarina sp. TaxID=1872439 RepID=UPI0025C32FB8|nr:3'-5' exonuclease [Aliidiomarina sp.]MCH8502248.1 3'-5' exonuclease [Aliidiomarina sp.]